MLSIIGLSHFAQSRKPGSEKTEGQNAYTAVLDQLIKDVKPIFVAEEHSEEALGHRNEVSIAKELADASAIEHRFCDPTEAQRASMGYVQGGYIFQHFVMDGNNQLSNEEARLKADAIEMGRYFAVREQFWLGGLSGCIEGNAIFVCGYGHIKSFTQLLDSKGIPNKVVASDVAVTEEERERIERNTQYLNEHPELRNWTSKSFPSPRLIP
jgi:hypothetical protein